APPPAATRPKNARRAIISSGDANRLAGTFANEANQKIIQLETRLALVVAQMPLVCFFEALGKRRERHAEDALDASDDHRDRRNVVILAEVEWLGENVTAFARDYAPVNADQFRFLARRL